MNDIFEYYTLKLTTKSPVHIGSGQTIGKKEFCLIPKKDKIRIMDMEKLIDYFVKEDPENLEWFEKFMIEDPSLRAKTRRAKDGTLYTGAECLDKKWLHTFLNLIAMPVPARKDCALYEISNDGMFQDDKTAYEISSFLELEDDEIKRFRKKKIPKKFIDKMEKERAQRMQERQAEWAEEYKKDLNLNNSDEITDNYFEEDSNELDSIDSFSDEDIDEILQENLDITDSINEDKSESIIDEASESKVDESSDLKDSNIEEDNKEDSDSKKEKSVQTSLFSFE